MPKRSNRDAEEQSKRPKIDQQTTSDSVNVTKEDIPWTDNDLLELLARIEENIPKDDSLAYNSRLNKIDWGNITVKSHSSEECKEAWNALYKQVRKFRLLGEIVGDMKNVIRVGQPKTLTRLEKSTSPQKPKQPSNSYMLFVEEKRAEVMRDNPTLPPQQVSRKLGDMFKNLPLEEKERYKMQFKVKQEEYKLKMQDFYKEHPKAAPRRLTKKHEKEPEKQGPFEKPKTPFELFVKVESEKDTSTERFIKVQKCRELWHEMTDKDKYFWIKWADELYSKYLEDLKEHLRHHPEYEPEKIKYVLTKKEKQIKEHCSGKPEKPPYGAYNLFSKMILESPDVKNISSKDVVNYVSEKWRGCSEDEKNEYRVRVEHMWEEYHQRLEEYIKTLPPEERDRVREESIRKKKTDAKIEAVRRPVARLPKPETPPKTAFKYFLKNHKGGGNPSSLWKGMSEDEKADYEERLKEEKKKYIVQYENYLKSLSREELEKLGATMGGSYCAGSTSESESSSNDDD